MIYDLWIINHHRRFTDLKSLNSNQPKFDLRFIIQLSNDLAELVAGGNAVPINFVSFC